MGPEDAGSVSLQRFRQAEGLSGLRVGGAVGLWGLPPPSPHYAKGDRPEGHPPGIAPAFVLLWGHRPGHLRCALPGRAGLVGTSGCSATHLFWAPISAISGLFPASNSSHPPRPWALTFLHRNILIPQFGMGRTCKQRGMI